MVDPDKPIIYVLDEYVSGAATPEAHARAIIEMCTRNHIEPGHAVGQATTSTTDQAVRVKCPIHC